MWGEPPLPQYILDKNSPFGLGSISMFLLPQKKIFFEKIEIFFWFILKIFVQMEKIIWLFERIKWDNLEQILFILWKKKIWNKIKLAEHKVSKYDQEDINFFNERKHVTQSGAFLPSAWIPYFTFTWLNLYIDQLPVLGFRHCITLWKALHKRKQIAIFAKTFWKFA